MIIYKATNKINDKVYIGQTIHILSERIRKHKNNGKNSTYFSRALKKYGFSNFVWEIIETCDSKEELNEMEFHYIKQYNSLTPNGYNLTLGGEGSTGYKHTEQSKEKMRFTHLGENNNNYGKKFSDEHKRKISEANKGKPKSLESIIKSIESRYKSGKNIGSNSKFAKRFVIVKPDGTSFVIHGLVDFCRRYDEQQLDFKLLSRVSVGKCSHHKGYKCISYNEALHKDIKEYKYER